MWLPEDLELLIAYAEYTDSLCPGCGHPLEETTDPKADPAEGAHWDVAVLACHACAAKGQTSRGRFEHGVPPGVLFSVTRQAEEEVTLDD